MRVDRTVSIAMSMLHAHRGGHRVAVLMYHSISDRVQPRLHPYFKTVTSPARFAQQMQWLAEADAEVVGLDTWSSPSAQGHAHRVVITFDDGFADFLTSAFPVLRAYGYVATMFLPTAFIETGRELLPGMKHLGWDEVRQLHLAGMHFGSHTVHHFHLENLSNLEIDKEVRTSSETIRKQLGGNVTCFSCPFSFPQAHPVVTSALRQSLADCGYTVAVTTRIGTASIYDDPYTLKRLPVNSYDDRDLFMAKLNGGYDWLNGVQRLVRSVKKGLRR